MQDAEKELEKELELLVENSSDLKRIVLFRGSNAMPLENAAAIARKVMLHLFRGSIECARASLEEGWTTHIEDEAIEDGAAILEEPLSRIFRKNDLRLLNSLERVGIITVGDLVHSTDADWLAIENVGPSYVAKLIALKSNLKQRAAK